MKTQTRVLFKSLSRWFCRTSLTISIFWDYFHLPLTIFSQKKLQEYICPTFVFFNPHAPFWYKCCSGFTSQVETKRFHQSPFSNKKTLTLYLSVHAPRASSLGVYSTVLKILVHRHRICAELDQTLPHYSDSVCTKPHCTQLLFLTCIFLMFRAEPVADRNRNANKGRNYCSVR